MPDITFKKFKGINNVLPSERLSDRELVTGMNVDIGNDDEITRRAGFAAESATAHLHVWEADTFTLAVRGGDLINVDTGTVLHAGVGTARMWYVNLPDGRTAYTNGTVSGIVTSAARTTWGVPIPIGVGVGVDVAGNLHPGDYQWAVTHVRTSDGLESGPAYSGMLNVADGGISLSGLPVLAGHTTNVYLTSHYGGQTYYAGNTANAMFAYTGKNDALVLPSRTDFCFPAPAGKLPAMWQGRALVAVGAVLYASRFNQPELFDLRRDMKQFSAPITMVQAVDGGLYVGTETELMFLEGKTFDNLSLRLALKGGVVLGSGVTVNGEQVRFGDGVGQDDAMICIADRLITAGFKGGQILRMTEGRYVTDVQEVAATFRTINGVPQYIALDMAAATPAPTPAPTPLLFEDTFTGTADTAVIDHVSDSGHSWFKADSYGHTATGIELNGSGALYKDPTAQFNARVTYDFEYPEENDTVMTFQFKAQGSGSIILGDFLGDWDTDPITGLYSIISYQYAEFGGELGTGVNFTIEAYANDVGTPPPQQTYMANDIGIGDAIEMRVESRTTGLRVLVNDTVIYDEATSLTFQYGFGSLYFSGDVIDVDTLRVYGVE